MSAVHGTGPPRNDEAASPPGASGNVTAGGGFASDFQHGKGTATSADALGGSFDWDARPELAHVRDFARARLSAPLPVLAVVLTRIITATPYHYVLPPTVGGDASLNLFAAIVAPSGHGKGAAEAAARDAVRIEGITQLSLGSGEGIARTFGHRERRPDGGTHIVRDHDAIFFDVREVDTLTALGARQGATLMPQVRQGYSGEQLGFAYGDPHKAITIAAHSYRFCLVVGVQPGRAGPILDDADGGTPQRFLWVPATDPGAPLALPVAPEQITWHMPEPSAWGPAALGTGRRAMGVPDVAREAVILAAQARNRGEIEALDGHALLTRLKVGAALALFAGRTSIDDEDWSLAGQLMAISDHTRAGVVQHLDSRRRASNEARGEMEGSRAVMVAETVYTAQVKRVAQTIGRALRKRDAWATHRDVAVSVAGRDRAAVDDALDRLVEVGQVEIRDDDGKPSWRLAEASS